MKYFASLHIGTFEAIYLPEVREFFRTIDSQATSKLIYNINKASLVDDNRIFKKLKNSQVWEFRANVKSIQYRVFAFWDTKQKSVVVCTHGIVKKTQKTPQKEIEKTEQIRKKYLGLQNINY